MCKSLSEGGQRCAAHTKAKLERAAAHMRSAAARAETKDDLVRFHQAREAWEEAAVEYASTPTGAAALTERRDRAEADGDPHTAAMLGTIIQRGENMRAVNDQMRAALTIAAFTETGLPDTSLSEVIAADENGNALSEADQQAWLRLVDAVAAQGSHSHGLVRAGQDLAAADATIASRTATDADLSRAAMSLTGSARHGDWINPNQFNYDDNDGGWQRSVLGVDHRGALLAQVRRAVAHPHAGERTMLAARRMLPADEVLTNPKSPVTLLADTPEYTAQRLAPQTWEVLRARRAESPRMAVFLAQHDPDEYAREDARQAIVSLNWDQMDPYDMRHVRQSLPECLSEQEQALVEESMMTWVRDFGTEEHRQQVYTWEEQRTLAAQQAAASVPASRSVAEERRRTRPGSLTRARASA